MRECSINEYETIQFGWSFIIPYCHKHSLNELLLCINIFQFLYGIKNRNDGVAHQDWGGEKLVSIKFPQNASNITLDVPETATIDVSDCETNVQTDIRQAYKTTNNVVTSLTWVTYKDGTEQSFDISGDLKGGGYSPTTQILNVGDATKIELGNKITTLNSNIDMSYGTFYNCIGLTSITIPDSVTYIGCGAFFYCSGLTSITIPDSVTKIGSNAFAHCSGLTSVSIGNGVTSIDWLVFGSCSGLTTITIPDGVTSIGQQAFYNCSSLTSITIPDSVTSIGVNAFQDCRKLTSITFKGTTVQWNAITKGYNWKDKVPTTCKVYCTDGTIPA